MSDAMETPPLMHPEAVWSVEDIAYWHKRCSIGTARKLVCQPGFPAPVRLLGPDSYPGWFAGEVWEWARQMKAA